jgi:hypothetical protein
VAGPLIFDRGLWVIAGIGIAGAAEDALKPILEPARQNSWANRPWKVLDPAVAAQVRARQALTDELAAGIDLEGVDLADDALRNGIGSHRFHLLTELNRTWPGVSQLIDLRRRRLAFGGTAGIGRDDFRDGLRRQGYTEATIDALTDQLVAHLDVADIANAIQQGFVPDDGILPAATPPQPNWVRTDGPFTIPVEQVPIDPTNEAAYHGYDKAHLKVLAELVGLPPGEETLLDMWRRGIINDADYAAGLREGHTKTKWTAALSARFYQLLNPATLVNLRLRGYIEDPEYHDRMALHGYRTDQANDWFLSAGRPLAPQQMLDLIARKGPSPTGSGVFTFKDFRQGMVESDIKPKYSTPAEALYHKYPPLFQLRRAVESGGMTPARARAVMEIERYEAQDIDSLLASWKPAGATANPWVTKAHNQLWATTHRTFMAGTTTEPEARNALATVVGDPTTIDDVLFVWDIEKGLTRKTLTPAQIKKAYKEPAVNPATGASWTLDEAIAALHAQGYSVEGATAYLDI